jgi:hypothetical protein
MMHTFRLRLDCHLISTLSVEHFPGDPNFRVNFRSEAPSWWGTGAADKSVQSTGSHFVPLRRAWAQEDPMNKSGSCIICPWKALSTIELCLLSRYEHGLEYEQMQFQRGVQQLRKFPLSG